MRGLRHRALAFVALETQNKKETIKANEEACLQMELIVKPFTHHKKDGKKPKRVKSQKPNTFGGIPPVKKQGIRYRTTTNSLNLDLCCENEKTFLYEVLPSATMCLGDVCPELLQYLKTNTPYFFYDTLNKEKWVELKIKLKELAINLGCPKTSKIFKANQVGEKVELLVKREAPNDFLAKLPELIPA